MDTLATLERITISIVSPAAGAVIQGPSLIVSGSAVAWVRVNGERIESAVDEVIISITDVGSVEINPHEPFGFQSPPFTITTPGTKTISAVATYGDASASILPFQVRIT